MPYATVNELPSAVKRALGTGKDARSWMHIWNSAYRSCSEKGSKPADCEARAFATANGTMKRQGKPV